MAYSDRDGFDLIKSSVTESQIKPVNLSDGFDRLSNTTHFTDCCCSACDANNVALNASSNSAVDYQDLIWDYQVLESNLRNSESVRYSLYRGPWEYTTAYNHREHELHVMHHTGEQRQFIQSVFQKIDNIIDLDFTMINGDSPGDIRIYRAYYNSSWGDRFSGGGVGGGTMYGQSAGIDLEWHDASDVDEFYEDEKSTIVHEIGHALGLDHPDGVGANPHWDRYDSIMSYNNPNGLPRNIEFTSNDIAALIQIWGIEDDNGRGFKGSSSGNYLKGTIGHDIIAGFAGDDDLRGTQGKDTILGHSGEDTIRGGNGRDELYGGSGADDIYGGFGHNTFAEERDESVDWLYFKSDQFAENWLYGRAGMNPNGQKVDVLKGLDPYDKILIQGVETSELSFGDVNNFSSPTGNFSGIGIFANGFLEGLYTGGDLSAVQLQSMTVGVDA